MKRDTYSMGSPSDRIQLTPREVDLVCQILRAHAPGLRWFVYGSRATGRAQRFSDVDLATTGPLNDQAKWAIKEAFSESDLPYLVDVTDLSSTSPEFSGVVSRDMVELDLIPRHTNV